MVEIFGFLVLCCSPGAQAHSALVLLAVPGRLRLLCLSLQVGSQQPPTFAYVLHRPVDVRPGWEVLQDRFWEGFSRPSPEPLREWNDPGVMAFPLL